MAKLHKIEMYIVDVNDNYENLESIISEIDNMTNVSLVCFNKQSVEFHWFDKIDINLAENQIPETYRKYFK